MSWISPAADRSLVIVRNLRGILGIAALAGLLWGCIPSGKRPFLQVQLCVVDQQGLSTFTSLMREIARSEKMSFVDGSEETLKQFESARETIPDYKFTKPVIHMGVERDDMMGLTAANIGLPSYQIVIGFNVGDSESGAQEFAQRVVGALKRHWAVETVPAGKGAFPMESCKNGASDANEGPNASKAR